jgi:hypothetical protein
MGNGIGVAKIERLPFGQVPVRRDADEKRRKESERRDRGVWGRAVAGSSPFLLSLPSLT